jgi:nitrile hydratase
MKHASFEPGTRVRVRAAFPPGHVRTPWYTRGRCGVVESHAGDFANPEELAYGRSGAPPVPLYRVRFAQRDLWDDYAGPAHDSLVVDIYAHWLEAAGSPLPGKKQRKPQTDGR